jgi:bifunctional lysine-specific demethylase and histidyl-hydroxylase NO66
VTDVLDLLSGDAQTFVEKIWARQVHVHHADPAVLSGYLGLDDVDHLVTSTAMRTPAIRMARDGAVLPASAYTTSATLAGAPLTGLVDGRKVLDLFETGATLVLQGLHRYWRPLTELVKQLEVELGHPCQANAYLTPPGSQGFARHKDTHDVFVFQTAGRKRWEIDDGGGPQEVMLEPGVSMYLPTGTLHAARTEQSASLHVTVGANQVTWRRLLERSVADVLGRAEYDAAIPAGYVDDAGPLTNQLAERLRSLAAGIAVLDPVAQVDRELESFLGRRPTAVRGGLVDRLALPALDDDTVLSRREGAVCVLRPAPDRLALLLGDRVLWMPARLTPAIEYVRAHPSLMPRDLDGLLDEQSRLVLTRRLVREGLLRVGG